MIELYAHSGDGMPPQLYAEHVHNVRRTALEAFDRVFRHHKRVDMVRFLRRVLEVAAEWHDSGKIMPECQAILSQSVTSDAPMLNHVDLGVSCCVKEYRAYQRIVLSIGGLVDTGSPYWVYGLGRVEYGYSHQSQPDIVGNKTISKGEVAGLSHTGLCGHQPCCVGADA